MTSRRSASFSTGRAADQSAFTARDNTCGRLESASCSDMSFCHAATSRAAAVICAMTLLVAAMLASPPACSGNTHCAVSASGEVASLTNADVIAPPSRK